MRVLLITYDNESHINYFPLGTAYLAAAIKQVEGQITIYNQDLIHSSEEDLIKYIEKSQPDLVGVGMVAGYYPYKKLLAISDAINITKNRRNFKYLLGGHISSTDPKYFLEKTLADIVVMGEGEETIKEIVNNKTLHEIKGIAFWYENCRGGCEVQINAPRELIQDLDSLPIPAYELFNIDVYKLQRHPNIKSIEFSTSMVTGRGCPYHCTFCYRMMEGIRLRSIGKIVEEIKLLKEKYGITYIDFMDDLTMSSKQRALELSEALKPLGIRWRCEGRLNYVDKHILEVMKDAGCVFINYGIESLDNQVLKNMKKGLTKEVIIKGVETTLEVGISPGLNIIWGNIGDTEETLQESVDFLLKYSTPNQLRTIRFVTPYPGCELYKIAIEKGLIKDIEDFYKKHLNSDLLTINFTNMSDEVMYNALYEANLKLLNKYYSQKKFENINLLVNLYKNKDTTFRGFRHT